jgi:hypothetical protein
MIICQNSADRTFADGATFAVHRQLLVAAWQYVLLLALYK